MKYFVYVLIAIMSGCASTVVPSNVSVNDRFVETIDFSIPTSNKDKLFNKIKICIAENIDNDGVSLLDSSGSFVGSYSGTLYTANNSRETASGRIFELADKDEGVLIFNGIHEYEGMLATPHYLKYKAKVVIERDNLKLKFYKLKSAQKSTGFAENSGFKKLGTWSGFDNAYTSLEAVKNKISGCVI